MKLKLFALCLAAVAAVLITIPPAFAHIEDPLFGVSWRPDICAQGNPNIYVCQQLNGYVVNVIGAQAFEYALNSTCSTNTCYIAFYTEYMDSFGQQTCFYPGVYGGGEMESWCVELFNVFESQTIDLYWREYHCEGAC